MATSSGNTTTTTTTTISSSGSEGDLQQVVVLDDRKRKRMASNRESARRSRMRKQKHLDDMTAQVASLVRDNDQVVQTINVTTQQFLNVEAENSVLRAQMSELSQRLQSLNEIVNYVNALGGSGSLQDDGLGELGYGMGPMGDFGIMNGYNGNLINNNFNSWNMGYMNQPIMASADAALQY